MRAGNYNITQTGFLFDHEIVGTLGGTLVPNQFASIVVPADAIGLYYDFYNIVNTGGGGA